MMSVEMLCTIVSTAIAVLVLLIDCERTRIEGKQNAVRLETKLMHHDEKIDFLKDELEKCQTDRPIAECKLNFENK